MFCKVCFVLVTSWVESTSFHASGALLDVITNNVFREVLQAFHDKLLVTKKSWGAHLESKIMERHVKETKISGLLEKWATSYLNRLELPLVSIHMYQLYFMNVTLQAARTLLAIPIQIPLHINCKFWKNWGVDEFHWGSGTSKPTRNFIQFENSFMNPAY